MRKLPRTHSAKFKFKVALEALKEIKSINQIASEYEISSSLVCDWKKQLISNGFKIYATDPWFSTTQPKVYSHPFSWCGFLQERPR